MLVMVVVVVVVVVNKGDEACSGSYSGDAGNGYEGGDGAVKIKVVNVMVVVVMVMLWVSDIVVEQGEDNSSD